VTTAPDLAAAAEELGRFLGLGEPANAAATARALADPKFARALAGTSKLPDLVQRLLHDPRNEAFLTVHADQSDGVSQTLVLAGRAAGALASWTKDGLKRAGPDVIARRLDACGSCAFRAPAPDTMAFRAVRKVMGPDIEICSICSCVIRAKAAIPGETCPTQDPEDPGLSLWGEPWKPDQ